MVGDFKSDELPVKLFLDLSLKFPLSLVLCGVLGVV